MWVIKAVRFAYAYLKNAKLSVENIYLKSWILDIVTFGFKHLIYKTSFILIACT